ncbi:MAG: hypothetical protein CL883_05535 [Dehalococcoidia bacterium]|nr:hypothetical protein [Dehalococcoidia bacterium]
MYEEGVRFGLTNVVFTMIGKLSDEQANNKEFMEGVKDLIEAFIADNIDSEGSQEALNKLMEKVKEKRAL